MDRAMDPTRASELPQQAWERWEREHTEVLERATRAQRVLLEATVRFVAVIAAQPILLRLAAFFQLHAGMELTPAQVGAAVGRTDRAMRTVRASSVQDVLTSIWAELGRHRQPKLHAEHAGPIAKYMVEHPRCRRSEVVAFLATELKIDIDVHTLSRFLEAYGLNILRRDRESAGEGDDARPLSLGAPISGAPSSSCPPRSP